MISETTNFSRDSIGTPTLNAYEDIRLNEVSLKELILDDSETETADVVSILGTENFIRRDAETIHAFRFGCKDYFGRFFNYVAVRRKNGDNDMNSFESTDDVWMAAICYDKNNNIVETFFSNEKNRQENDVYETTWNFDPFIIKSSYAFIEFRITQTEGEVNLNPPQKSMKIRTSNIIHNPIGNSQKKFYIEGWYTVDQDNNIRDFTTDFVIGMTKRYSSLTKHVTDIDVHLTQDLRDKIENISDDISSQLIPFDERLGNVEKEIDTLTETVQTPPAIYEKTFNLGLNVEGYEAAYGIDVGVSNLKKGYISHVEIFSEIDSNRSGSFGDYYLAAQIFKKDESNSVIYPTKKTIYSTSHININEETQKYVYDFDDLYVSDDDYFVRFMIVDSSVKGTIVPQPNSNGNVGIMLVNYDATHSNNTSIISTRNGVSTNTPRCDISYGFENKLLSNEIYNLDNVQKSISNRLDKGIYDKDVVVTDECISFSGNNRVACQEIFLVQLCGNHKVEGRGELTKIIVEQNTTANDGVYTKDTPLYLVIYGDKTGNDDYEFIGNSINTQKQIKNGNDMVFYFSNENIGNYFKYRLFYSYDVTTIPSIPTRLEDTINMPKMAFNAYDLGETEKNCAIWTNNFSPSFRRTFPAQIYYKKFNGEDVLLHNANSSLHLSDEQISIINDSNSHIKDEDIHLSESEKYDISKISEIEKNTYDSLGETMEGIMSFSSDIIKPAQGIRKIQICNNHKLHETARLKSIIIPQNTSASNGEFTSGRQLFLIIYGDISGRNDFVYVTISQNTQEQIKGGPEMKFDFNYENIGKYFKLRLFYAFATDENGTPIDPDLTEPDKTKNESHYLNEVPKMAFNAYEVDDTCSIWPDNGTETKKYTIPLRMFYDFYEGDVQLHKTNTKLHLSETQIENISKIPSLEAAINGLSPVSTSSISENSVTSDKWRIEFVVKRDDSSNSIIESVYNTLVDSSSEVELYSSSLRKININTFEESELELYYFDTIFEIEKSSSDVKSIIDESLDNNNYPKIYPLY